MTAVVVYVMRWGIEGEQQHTMAFTALALAQMARQGNDESRAQACERAAAEVA